MEKRKGVITTRYAIGSFILAIAVPYLPLIITQRWEWWEAWVFAILSTLGFVISRGLAAKRHPDLLVERGRMLQQAEEKRWDKLLAPLWLLIFDATIVVAGVDRLFGWSAPFSLPVIMLSLLIFLAGYCLGSWALIENRFFSGINRIQTERGHVVVSSGPYAWLRHPGYAGPILSYLAVPFLLESWWAGVPVLLLTVVGIIRTDLEDRMLQNELAGYREYAQRVRYRLVPGVW